MSVGIDYAFCTYNSIKAYRFAVFTLIKTKLNSIETVDYGKYQRVMDFITINITVHFHSKCKCFKCFFQLFK